MSSGVTLLFSTAFVVSVKCHRNGTSISAMMPACTKIEITCVQPKFSSFDQISFTFTGLISNGNGATFGGKKKSLIRSPNPPKLVSHLLASCPLVEPFGTGLDLKNSPTFAQNPPPYSVGISGER